MTPSPPPFFCSFWHYELISKRFFCNLFTLRKSTTRFWNICSELPCARKAKLNKEKYPVLGRKWPTWCYWGWRFRDKLQGYGHTRDFKKTKRRLGISDMCLCYNGGEDQVQHRMTGSHRKSTSPFLGFLRPWALLLWGPEPITLSFLDCLSPKFLKIPKEDQKFSVPL